MELVLRARKPSIAVITHIKPPAEPKLRQFNNLPVEIKEKIHEYTVHMDGQFDILFYATTAEEISFSDGILPLMHATCRTNKLEWAIATMVMLRHSTVCLCRNTYASNMMNWIKASTSDMKQGLSAIKHVELRYVSRYRVIEAAEDIQFLESCATLHTVVFVFRPKQLRGYSNHKHVRPSLTSREMLDKLGLVHLAACKQLKRVVIKIQSTMFDHCYK
jgi:hypothetical protein